MESKDSSEDNGGPQETSVDVPQGSDSKTEESDAGNVQDGDPENVPEEKKEENSSEQGKRKRTEDENSPPEKRSKSDIEDDGEEQEEEEDMGNGEDKEEGVDKEEEEEEGENKEEEETEKTSEENIESEDKGMDDGESIQNKEVTDSNDADKSETMEEDEESASVKESESTDNSEVKKSTEEETEEKSEKLEEESEELETIEKDREKREREERSGENDSVKSLESESLKSSKDSLEDEKASEGPEESSSVKSEDSEKENRRADADTPIDLTTKSGLPNGNGGSDVIMLSDSEEELMNGVMNGEILDLDECEIWKRRKIVKRLQAELRNEEAKLILLRKMRQSQVSSPSIPEKPKQQHAQPPPLVRPGQQPSQARPAHSQPPQLVRNSNQTPSRSHQQGPPPLVNMRGQNLSNGNSLSQQMRYQGMQGQPGSRGMYGSSSQTSQNNNAQVDTQTPAQRQAAAKMALRKQLEKTLLQIPPPKPPPPEMNFVPSLSSTDFIYLLGLEEAVNYIIDANLISKGQKNPDEKMVCNPFTCVQCNTDFTPVWKREKAGSKNVICEHCVTTNQKKALKQEHTNRLKSAFVKALQQEQEIERMQAQEKTSGPSHGSSSPANNSAASSSSNSAMNIPSNSASFKATSEAIRQHQNFLQAHQAVTAHQAALRMGQPLGLAPFGAPGPFPYQIPFGGAKASDLNSLQRKYLLDMIPPNRWSK